MKELARLLRRARRNGEISSRLPIGQLARLLCGQLSMLYVEHCGEPGVPRGPKCPTYCSSCF